MVFTIIFYAFCVWIAYQYGYALIFVLGIRAMKATQKANSGVVQPVSVIICAKNEAANLASNLPAILAQNYRDKAGNLAFEVIVVNDASNDGTSNILTELSNQYPHLRTINVPTDVPRTLKGKKFALQHGVLHANFEWLLLTDADCVPATDQWTKLMTAPLAAGKEIVAGYGTFHLENNLINAFTRWEAAHSFLLYTSFATMGLPYMAVGRNMACTKTIFRKAQASPHWNATSSGDDDMLVNACATPANYAVVANPASFTYSQAKSELKSWIAQKQRHLSTGKRYKPVIRYLLGSYGYTVAGVWVYFPFTLLSQYATAAIVLMIVRCLILWLIMARTCKILGEKKLAALLPVFDFMWMIYNFAFFPYIISKNRQNWK